jgi:hypothetical protein
MNNMAYGFDTYYTTDKYAYDRSPIDQALIDQQKLVIKQLREANERLDKKLVQEKSLNQGIRDTNNLLVKQLGEKLKEAPVATKYLGGDAKYYYDLALERAKGINTRDAEAAELYKRIREQAKTISDYQNKPVAKDCDYCEVELKQLRRDLATQKAFVTEKNQALDSWYKANIKQSNKINELRDKVRKIQALTVTN